MKLNDIKNMSLAEIILQYGYTIKPVIAKEEQRTRKITEREMYANQEGFLIFNNREGKIVKRRIRKYEKCNECFELAVWIVEHKLYRCPRCKNIMNRDLKNIYTDDENPFKVNKFVKKTKEQQLETEKKIQEVKKQEIAKK